MARLKNRAPRPYRAWSYRAGNSPLHRCPAGIKLILLLALSAAPVFGPFAAGGAAALIFAGAFSAGLGLRALFAGSRPLVIMMFLFAVFRALGTEAGQPLIAIGRIGIDLAGLQSGLYLAAGILVCYAAASLFFTVTTTTEIRRSLAKAELFVINIFRKQKVQQDTKQGRLSLSLALMLGFLPRFFEYWENARLAACARGCTGGLRQVTVILPLVTERMIEAAAETAEALESRGLEL
jgi:energy-coupling factor transporter transmembrane protein EcfT